MRAFFARRLLWLSSRLPLRFNHAIGALLGRIIYRYSDRYRELSRRNIARCFPEWSEVQREELVRNSLIEAGKSILESGALWLWTPQAVMAKVRKVSGGEMLQQAMAEGKGVIFAAPHLGAWEVIGLYGSVHWPMTSLYRPLRLAGLDKLIRAGRERAGARLVPTDASGVRALFKALANGDLVGILPDQDPGPDAGVFAPFFGVTANTMTLLTRLVRKTGARVFFAYAERLSQGQGYHVHFIPAPDGLTSANIEQAAASLNKGVEACVRQLPVQYQWAYERFKTQPETGADVNQGDTQKTAD